MLSRSDSTPDNTPEKGPAPMRFLLVEDDRMIGDSLRAALRMEGHAVDWVRDAEAAQATLASERFDLALLDLGLPRGNGLDVLRAMRSRGDATPVIVLTARDGPGDRVAGLDAGADDYLVKPFELDELGARIRAVLRRQAGRAFMASSQRCRCGRPSTLTPDHLCVRTQHQLAMSAME